MIKCLAYPALLAGAPAAANGAPTEIALRNYSTPKGGGVTTKETYLCITSSVHYNIFLLKHRIIWTRRLTAEGMDPGPRTSTNSLSKVLLYRMQGYSSTARTGAEFSSTFPRELGLR